MKLIRLSVFVLFLLANAIAAFGQVIVEGKLTHELEVETGSAYTDIIVLRNTGEETEEVKLYQTDYESNSEGYHYYNDPESTLRSNAGWISISPKRFTIPAGETHIVNYTLSVPHDETLTGSYWSVLMIEPIPKGSPESSDFDPEKTNVGVGTLLRFAVKFVTHIEKSGTIAPKILAAKLESVEDQRFLSIAIENAGTRLLKIHIWAELYDSAGGLAGKFAGESAALFPGSSLKFPIDLSEAETGEYTTLVVIDCGNNNVFGANYTLVFD